MLSAIAGYDDQDPTTKDVPVSDYSSVWSASLPCSWITTMATARTECGPSRRVVRHAARPHGLLGADACFCVVIVSVVPFAKYVTAA